MGGWVPTIGTAFLETAIIVKDYSLFGSILGYLYLGSYHIS